MKRKPRKLFVARCSVYSSRTGRCDSRMMVANYGDLIRAGWRLQSWGWKNGIGPLRRNKICPKHRAVV